MTAASLRWTWCRLQSLSALDVHDVLSLRSEVFVVEQNCVFLDADPLDLVSWHLIGRDADNKLACYLRVTDPGEKYDEVSIGRVVTRQSLRRKGYGVALMREAIRRARAIWPEYSIRIGAQYRLEAFYKSLGFLSEKNVYLEDGIEHIEMVLPDSKDSSVTKEV